MRTRETARAKRASEVILELKQHPEAGDIRTEIEALPARIRANGLLQTIVYLLEKDKKDRNAIGKPMVLYLAGSDARGLLPKIALRICTEKLREATEDAFAFANWLKLMAKAELPKKQTFGGEEPHDEPRTTTGDGDGASPIQSSH